MLTSEEYNVLGGIVDTTWGRSSSVEGQPASRGLKWQLLGEGEMIGTCSMVVHISSYQNMSREKDQYSQECAAILNAAIKKIKDDFKEAVGRSLKVETQHTDDLIELYAGIPGPALFKFKAIVTLD